MRKRGLLALLALLVAALAFAAAGCGGDEEPAAEEAPAEAPAEEPPAEEPAEEPPAEEPAEPPAEGGGVTALPSSSCGEVEFGGEGEPQVLIASDLPLQGASRIQTTQINNAIRFVLDQRGWKAGDVNVAFQACDDATAQAGKWDSGKCNQNAQSYAGNESVVGVIGTFNSGCAAIDHPGAEPGAGRRDRDALAGEHLPVPDRGRAGVRGHGTGPVLPVRRAQLCARRGPRRVPGRRRRAVLPERRA